MGLNWSGDTSDAPLVAPRGRIAYDAVVVGPAVAARRRLIAASRALAPGLRRCAHAFVVVLSVTAALLFLLAIALLLFRNALVDGLVYYRSDTVIFYYPIMDTVADVIREGRLLLWTRYIFGGFPLFADGEAGMLYPPHVLAYILLSEQDAFIWGRIARYFMAALFTYVYVRTLRLNGFAAAIGALTFAFGSFMVIEMHHTNIGNTAIWLPLTLAFVELAVRNVRRRRWFFVTLAGVSTGIQSLGLHIQPLLLSGLFLALYVPFRAILCPIAWPKHARITKDQEVGSTKDTKGAKDAKRRFRPGFAAFGATIIGVGAHGVRPFWGLLALSIRGLTSVAIHAIRGSARMAHRSVLRISAGMNRTTRASTSETGGRPPCAPISRMDTPAGHLAPRFRLLALPIAATQRATRALPRAFAPFAAFASFVLQTSRRFASFATHVFQRVASFATQTSRRSASPVLRSSRRSVSFVLQASRRFAPFADFASFAFRRSLLPASRLVALWVGILGGLALRFLLQAVRALVGLVAGSFHRAVLAGLLLGLVPAIAFGIAAVQALPLAELGLFSFRGTGNIDFQFATSYSMPVQNLVNLVFPYFFRYTNRAYWSLWSEWETTLYIGIAPLVLASIALLFVRNRMVLFFGAVGVLSLLLALGGYSPYPDLYKQLIQLPGFSSLRVPARFSMLTCFSLAALAAYGTDYLARTLRPSPSDVARGPVPRDPAAVSLSPRPSRLSPLASFLSPDRWRRFSRAVGIHAFGLYLVGLGLAMAGVAWWLLSFRIWIEKEPWAVKRFVEQSYLSLRSARPWLTSDMVLSFLNYSLDPTNPKTVTSLALMLATFLLLFCWFAFRSLWRAWASLLVMLVAADLLLFATDFHPTVPVNQLATPDSAARWLMAHNPDGMSRVYTSPEAHKTEANRLLPFRVPEITGYSSLQTNRHLAYMAATNEYDKGLLDLYGARFVVLPKQFPALPSYEYTAYHPFRPLADGARSNRGAHVTFYMNPPVKADELSLISNLRRAPDIPQDAEVADITVVDTQGQKTTLKVRAGRETAEWAHDRPDVAGMVSHKRVQVADHVNAFDPWGNTYPANMYFGEFKLPKTTTVASVQFDYIYPTAAMRLYGMMLWENPSTAHQILGRDKFIPRYEDDEVVIMENPSRLPRVYLVPQARIVKQSEMLDAMVGGDFDPEREVLLEVRDKPKQFLVPLPDAGQADPEALDWVRGSSDTKPGTAEIVAEPTSTDVTVRIHANRDSMLFMADSYYPGWRVHVDGREEKIYRADLLFRAVPVPAGDHTVHFLYDPDSFELGKSISTFTLSSLGAVWSALLVIPLMVAGSRWVWSKRRSTRQQP